MGRLCLAYQICTVKLVLLGIVFLILYLVYRPSEIKVHVVNATLRDFNLTGNNNNQIRYNLALDMSVRNTNRKLRVKYERIQAEALYEGKWFATTDIDTFFQGRKNTTMIHPVFHGTSNISLSGSDIRRFNSEKNNGTFNIDVKLNLQVVYKIVGDAIKTKKLGVDVKCDVRVPLTSSHASVDAFNTKKCIVFFRSENFTK